MSLRTMKLKAMRKATKMGSGGYVDGERGGGDWDGTLKATKMKTTETTNSDKKTAKTACASGSDSRRN